MTSSRRPPTARPSARPGTGAYVWVWLPGATEPVVAGRLASRGDQLVFNYGRSYLARPDAIPPYEPELPLGPGALPLRPGLSMPGCIRDASPDAWGRRVIISRLTGSSEIGDTARLDELTYLLESGSDRSGALDFQVSARQYVPREWPAASLEELMAAAERVDRGLPVSAGLHHALSHGTSIGGARPKALIDGRDRKHIAKFSSSTDLYGVVKAEFVAMTLAAACGLDVAPVSLVTAAGRDVLLITRFDREKVAGGWHRKAMVSALTLLGLDEMMARYASYEELAEIVRHRFAAPKATLRELFGRIGFNILCGNTDDHARNHAAFWDGRRLSLAPAYDVCPQGRTGNEATQAMIISGESRQSRLAVLVDAAPQFLLPRADAIAIICRQIETIGRHWDDTCNKASLAHADRRLLAGRQFLNPYAFEGLADDCAPLSDLGERVRATALP